MGRKAMEINVRYGVIDIGSNTIRGVVYQTDEYKAIKVEDKLVRSYIMRETVAGKLTENGISRLVVVLNKLKYVLKKSGCKQIDCFATSAMRDLENIESVKEFVSEATDIKINVLSGEEEARCDFVAMRSNIPEHSAIGLDLGGGSGQLVQFEYNRLLFSESYRIGTGRINDKLVSGVIPTREERKKIEFYVKNELSDAKNIFGTRYLYVMGGSAKAALKLNNRLNNFSDNSNFLSVEKMEKLCNSIDAEPQRMYELFYDIVKNRADTVVTGIVILKTICKLLEVEGAYVLPCSVRDGYFAETMRKRRE